MEHDYLFKLIIVGDCGVGKSSLLLQFTDANFYDTYLSTIGVDFKIKTIQIDNKTVKLQIWDTAGQERFKSIITSYYRGSHGLLLVYDVTSEKSFNNLDTWLNEIKSNIKDRQITKILIGNKCENVKNREVQFSDAEEFALKNNLTYLETSAKTAENVTLAFEHIIKQLIANTSFTLKKSFELELELQSQSGPKTGNNILSVNKSLKSCC